MDKCALCGHGEQAQIEALFIKGDISATDIVLKLGKDKIEAEDVLVHMNDHPLALEEEVDRRKELLQMNEEEVSYQDPYEEEPFPTLDKPKIRKSIATLPALHSMYFILEAKLNKILAGKGVSGLSTIIKEMRQTLIEINRTKKEQKASLADRTDELFQEFEDLNDWLLFNLCDDCRLSLEKVLRKEEKIQTYSPERLEVKESGQDRTEYRSDASNL